MKEKLFHVTSDFLSSFGVSSFSNQQTNDFFLLSTKKTMEKEFVCPKV